MVHTPPPLAAAPSPDALETERRILDAAHRVFLRKGTAAARTQEIADEAGVNKALLHYYFGTKSALAEAVFAHHAGGFLPMFFAILADERRELDTKLRDAVREGIEFHSAHPYVASYLAAELHAEPRRMERMVAAHGRPPLQVLARQLDDAANAGRIRRISVEQFVTTLMGAMVMPFVLRPLVAQFLSLEGTRMDDFLVERKTSLAEFILAGLRP